MGFHVYCIAPAGHAIPDDCTGLDGVKPVALATGGIAAWATEHATHRQPDIDAIRIHNDVVNAAMTSLVTPVPIRFGQWFAGPDDAVTALGGDEGRWQTLLDRFAGHAEYGVRIVSALPHVPDTERDVHAARPQSGRDFMAALARRQAQAAGRREDGERIVAVVAERLEGTVADQRVEYPAAGDVLAALAHLVAWSAADAYHGAMSELRAATEDARLLPTGPWAPWSFVE